MAPVLDPEGMHLASLRRLHRLQRRVRARSRLRDGRLTTSLAEDAASVFAFDPDAAAAADLVSDFEDSRRDLPAEWISRLLTLDRPCAMRESVAAREHSEELAGQAAAGCSHISISES